MVARGDSWRTGTANYNDMWSDKETLRDCLGFDSYVEVLGDVCVEHGLAPLTLGVFGPWGSGKTSLMRMLEARLIDLVAMGRQDVKTIWFNAWRYEGSDETRSALIHAILEKLLEGRTLTEDIKLTVDKLKKNASVLKLAKFIAKTAVSLASPVPGVPDFDSFIGAFEKQSEEVAHSMEAFDRDFQAALKALGVQRLVIFIDDLDRCSSHKVVETFETIKLFLNTPECTFVLGADRRKIEDAVTDIYGVSDARRKKDFLEKIVQLPFAIPAQKLEDIVCYVGMLLIGRCFVNETCWDDLAKARPLFLEAGDNPEHAIRVWPESNQALFDGMQTVRDELDFILPHIRSVITALQGNPRQVKRFLNIVVLRRRLAKANKLDVQPAMLLKLTVVEYAWPEFFETLVSTVDPATGVSELLADIANLEEAKKVEESKTLREALSIPSLVSFLSAEPPVTGAIDLRPFLFLAQTSLYRERPDEGVSIDDQARLLARAAGSEDRIQSNAAAKRLAASAPLIADAAVKVLVQDLGTAKNQTSVVHIVRALDTIAQTHHNCFPFAVKALEESSLTVDDAVSVVATALLDHAKKAGVAVEAQTFSKFETKFSKLLRPQPKPTRGGVN